MFFSYVQICCYYGDGNMQFKQHYASYKMYRPVQINCMYMGIICRRQGHLSALNGHLFTYCEGHVLQTSGLLCFQPVWKQTPADGGVAHNQAAYWVCRAHRLNRAWLTLWPTKCCVESFAHACVCTWACLRAAISGWPVTPLDQFSYVQGCSAGELKD